MKILLAIIVPMLLCTAVQASTDLTIQWKSFIPATPHDVEMLAVGDTRIFLRALAPKKENDPPRSALFIGEHRAVSTPLYAGKWYQFAMVRRGEKLQFFVNGYPDMSLPTTFRGEVRASLADMKITDSALSADQILAHFKQQLEKRVIATVAHRGVHMHAPENTRISYVQALDAGAPILELDTALTKDGHIVLMHDKTVDRTTDGQGAVAEMTLAQLKKLDAGSWKNAKYEGEPVPTLDEIATIARGKAVLMLDLKATGQGKAISDWLASSRFPKDQLILAPWEDEEGAALRRYLPDIPMIRLTGRIPTDNFDDAYFARMKQIGFGGFSINWQNLTEAFVQAAQRNGMKIYVWTINESPDIAGAALLGVDGVITDDPAATMKILGELTKRD